MTGIVGRDTELDVLRNFVASIAVGASLLVLEGEAGVGKTTLWEAGAAEAEARGFRVLAARPVESETALSFSGLGDVLDTVLEQALAPLPEAQKRALSRALVLDDDEGPPPAARERLGRRATAIPRRPLHPRRRGAARRRRSPARRPRARWYRASASSCG